MKPAGFLLLIINICLMPRLQAQFYDPEGPFAHTYSIVAYDSLTGEIGAAVQSHWFSTGTIVLWAEAGTGAVATQSFVNPEFGPGGLELLRNGMSPREAVDSLINADEGRDVRQLAIVDATGRVAAFTGSKCIPYAGHIEGVHYSVQANMMLTPDVWPAMSKAFENTSGPLEERLMAALEAAENAGGDIRGRQSGAIVVVRKEHTGKPWIDRRVDLRVDDDPEPLVQMRRLLKVNQAYELMNKGDVAMEKNDVEASLDYYSEASRLVPENVEMKFWTAVSFANVNMPDKALPLFVEVFDKEPIWKELLRRIWGTDLFNPAGPEYDALKVD